MRKALIEKEIRREPDEGLLYTIEVILSRPQGSDVSPYHKGTNPFLVIKKYRPGHPKDPLIITNV